MDYGLIGKLEKAKLYAEDRAKFQFDQFSLIFHGKNAKHKVFFNHGIIKCDCEFFVTHHRCAHTMAVEILLKDMFSTDPDWDTEDETEPIAFDAATNYKLSLMKSQRTPHMISSKPSLSSATESPKKIDPQPSTFAEKKSIETQEFHIEGELSANVLQEAITPYLRALADLQHVIDQMANRSLSKVAIREIVSHD